MAIEMTGWPGQDSSNGLDGERSSTEPTESRTLTVHTGYLVLLRFLICFNLLGCTRSQLQRVRSFFSLVPCGI